MIRTKSAFAVFCLIVCATSVHAQDALRIQHTIQSAHPEQERTITVQLPPSYHLQTDYTYPVLYLLDGENNLDYSKAVAGFLAENAQMPEIIIVAVHAGATRARDYLPAYASAGDVSGQADQFLAYLAQELIPFIEETYRAAPLRLLSGHSYGGVFVIYALTQRPQIAQAYLTQSPYLDEAIGEPLLEQVTQAFAETPPLDAFLYMNLGDEPMLSPQFDRMETLLADASPASLNWFAEREAEKTHMTTRLVGQYEALARFFAEDWPLSQEQLMRDGYEGLERHLEALSMKYGYSVLYNEQAFQQATQMALSQQDVASALAAARLYVAQYAQAPTAHFLLGVSQVAGENREAGLEAIDTAIKLYEENPRPALQPLYENMKHMQQRLGAN